MDARTFARQFRDFARAPITQSSQAARGAWLRALEQLRLSLDLPSRRELSELTTRLEALDARIAALAADRALSAAPPSATLPAAAASEATPESSPESSIEAAPAEEAADEPTAPAEVVVAEAQAETDADAADEPVEAAAAGVNGHRRKKHKQKHNRR